MCNISTVDIYKEHDGQGKKEEGENSDEEELNVVTLAYLILCELLSSIYGRDKTTG